MKSNSIAACVKNDQGHLLTFTTRNTMEQCAEFAAEFWGFENDNGEIVWDVLQRMGCKVVQVELVEL